MDDIPEFAVFLILQRYSHLNPTVHDEMRKLFPDMVETPTRPPPRTTMQAEVTTIDGHPWVQISAARGKTSYATSFSRTHALLIMVSFLSKTQHDEAWYETRRQLLVNIVKTVTLTHSSGASTLPPT